jgi:hypothetical protein
MIRVDVPTRYSDREHAFFRWGVALALIVAFVTRPIHAEDQLFPKGITHFVDLTFLANGAVAWTVMGLAMAAGVVYAFGKKPILCLTTMLLVSIAVFTFAMSHTTKTRHDTNVVPLVLLGLLGGHLHYAWAARRGDPAARFDGRSRDDLAVFYALQMIAAIYVLSGITKLIRSEGEWIQQSYHFALQVIRTQHNIYYSALSPAGGLEFWTSVASFMVEHRWLTCAMFGTALFLELFAFTALFGRIWSLVLGVALIGFHLSVLALMSINFYLNMILLAFFFVNAPYWIERWRTRRASAA